MARSVGFSLTGSRILPASLKPTLADTAWLAIYHLSPSLPPSARYCRRRHLTANSGARGSKAPTDATWGANPLPRSTDISSERPYLIAFPFRSRWLLWRPPITRKDLASGGAAHETAVRRCLGGCDRSSAFSCQTTGRPQESPLHRSAPIHCYHDPVSERRAQSNRAPREKFKRLSPKD